MKTHCLLIAAMLGVVACTTVDKTVRISTDLQAMTFNDVASRYMARPTFVSTYKMSDGVTVLDVCMDTYAKSQLNPLGQSHIHFSKEHVTEYVSAIDKYLEWLALATERKDAFTKEISSIPTYANGANASLKFTFHSGNENMHFLVVAFSAAGVTLDELSQSYDQTNAGKLRSLLLAYAADSLQKTDIDSVYK